MKTLNPIPLAILAATLNFTPAFAQTDTRDVVRDHNGTIVRNTWGYCVRTKWNIGTDPCAPAVAPAVVRQRIPIANEDRTVYFEFNKATLMASEKTKLDNLANTLKSDKQVKEATVFGYADRIGTTSYNDKLSQKRAQTVSNYLISRGFTNARVTETRWFGESQPATQCPDSLGRAELIRCLQKDRRVEVEIEYLPQTTR